MEKMSKKEKKAQKNFLAKLKFIKRTTRDPVVVAMVGLVGSGKSSVAREIAPLIGATVISGDDIRVELRKQKERYEGARKIAENVAIEIIGNGGNAIIDFDCINPQKRASIREKAKKAGARAVFVRVYCDYDIMAGRILKAKFKNNINDFFGGASSRWGGEKKGAIVKLREMWRRTPNHYRWENKGGGKWILKKPAFKCFEVNTSSEEWAGSIKKIAKGLI